MRKANSRAKYTAEDGGLEPPNSWGVADFKFPHAVPTPRKPPEKGEKVIDSDNSRQFEEQGRAEEESISQDAGYFTDVPRPDRFGIQSELKSDQSTSLEGLSGKPDESELPVVLGGRFLPGAGVPRHPVRADVSIADRIREQDLDPIAVAGALQRLLRGPPPCSADEIVANRAPARPHSFR